jgi:hypothetical protein
MGNVVGGGVIGRNAQSAVRRDGIYWPRDTAGKMKMVPAAAAQACGRRAQPQIGKCQSGAAAWEEAAAGE